MLNKYFKRLLKYFEIPKLFKKDLKKILELTKKYFVLELLKNYFEKLSKPTKRYFKKLPKLEKRYNEISRLLKKYFYKLLFEKHSYKLPERLFLLAKIKWHSFKLFKILESLNKYFCKLLL